jgi:NADPH:quinone reductase
MAWCSAVPTDGVQLVNGAPHSSMHAIRLHAFGPAENLRYEEVADPEPDRGQVRIHVEAAGVHLVDTTIREGRLEGSPIPKPQLPAIPGREVAGVVDALGPDVDAAWLGRRVVAHLGPTGSGGYGELVVCAADRLHVLNGLSAEHAVAMIGTGRTTLAILDLADLRADDVVLVTAAAGGIGSLLVQAARNVGATVVGLAGSPAKVARVRDLGVSVAIDYTQDDWLGRVRDALDGRQISVAFDSVGGAIGRHCLELLGGGGRFIMFGFSAGAPTELSSADLWARSLTASVAIGPRIQHWPGGLRALEEQALAAASAGHLVPLVQAFPLAQAAAAHTALESRATTGKVVLVP